MIYDTGIIKTTLGNPAMIPTRYGQELESGRFAGFIVRKHRVDALVSSVEIVKDCSPRHLNVLPTVSCGTISDTREWYIPSLIEGVMIQRIHFPHLTSVDAHYVGTDTHSCITTHSKHIAIPSISDTIPAQVNQHVLSNPTRVFINIASPWEQNVIMGLSRCAILFNIHTIDTYLLVKSIPTGVKKC